MKQILLILSAVWLAGCSTPNPTPGATAAAYEQVKCGMNRQDVLALLGPPQSFQPGGDVNRCESATWSIPHDAHGRGHWTISFTGDTVTGVDNAYATVNWQR